MLTSRNIIMKVKFLEGISPIVFHFTGMVSGFKILSDDKFRLRANYTAASEDDIGEKFYFLSTTRSRLGEYHQSATNGFLFELDGRKLSHNTKANPVDYWKFLGGGDEMEDRIHSDKQYIEAIKFISKIEILIDEKSHPIERDEKLYKIALFAYITAKKNNIPIKIYRDRKGFRSRNPKSLFTPSEIKAFPKGARVDNKSKDRYDDKDNRLARFIEIYHKPFSELSREAKEDARSLVNSRNSYTNSIRAEPHKLRNVRDSHLSDKYNEQIKRIMKKEKVNNIDDLIYQMTPRLISDIKEDNKKARQRIHWDIYEKKRDLIDIIVNALESGQRLPDDKISNDERKRMALVDNVFYTILQLGLLSQEAESKYVSEYDTLNDRAWNEIFGIDITSV